MNPRGRIFALDLGAAWYDTNADDDDAYEDPTPFQLRPVVESYVDLGITFEPEGGLLRHALSISSSFL